MLNNLKVWLSEHRVAVTVVLAGVIEYLLLNNFSVAIPVTPFEEFVKTYTGFISVIVLGVPTWALISGNYKKVQQETKNLVSQQDLTIAQTLKTYKENLSLEVLENTNTLKLMQEHINLRDSRIDELAGEKAMRTNQINALTIEITSLKEAKVAQEAKILDLEKQLAEERTARQTAYAEIDRLKLYSDEVIQKLTNRVKVLEKIIIDAGLPCP